LRLLVLSSALVGPAVVAGLSLAARMASKSVGCAAFDPGRVHEASDSPATTAGPTKAVIGNEKSASPSEGAAVMNDASRLAVQHLTRVESMRVRRWSLHWKMHLP
jgi:hypothetical protein